MNWQINLETNMNDLKINITRSYGQKVSKNYQSKDYFASYTEEFTKGDVDIAKESAKLFALAKSDVENQIKNDYVGTINTKVDRETEFGIQEQDDVPVNHD